MEYQKLALTVFWEHGIILDGDACPNMLTTLRVRPVLGVARILARDDAAPLFTATYIPHVVQIARVARR